MNTQVDTTREHEWMDYYQRFDYFTPEAVRDGCQPRVMLHDSPAEQAIVLIHGLTDSPYFLTAIARHFHEELGFDCYLPLLHWHGLKDPQGMEAVELEEWKANVRFAVRSAAARSGRVSVGGLSTGGVLSFHAICSMPRINGDLYLFSAALDLAGGPFGLMGELKERLGRTFLADWFDSKSPLVGDNPYRYVRMDMDGARELSRLIRETDDILDDYDADNRFPYRVFAAHSACDRTAHIDGIWTLESKCHPERFTAHILSSDVKNCREQGVSHASLVLERPIHGLNAAAEAPPLEKHNPGFADMMAAISDFARNTA